MQGFPRADIDIPAVRADRQRLSGTLLIILSFYSIKLIVIIMLVAIVTSSYSLTLVSLSFYLFAASFAVVIFQNIFIIV